MAKWLGVITNIGNSVLSGWVDGKRLYIDRAMTGSGKVPEVSLMAQTGLTNAMYEASIISQERVEAGRKLKIQIVAQKNEYLMTQIGVWGRIENEDSHLIAIFQRDDSGISIPKSEDAPDFVYTFHGTIATNNTGELKLVIDPSAFVTFDTLIKFASSAGGILDADIAIPVDAWNQIGDVYRAEVPFDGVTVKHHPFLTIRKISKGAAHRAAIDTEVNTADGVIIFEALAVPDEVIYASGILVSAGAGNGSNDSSDGGGVDFILPTATPDRLGGVKIGDGVDVLPDGTISIDTDSVLDDFLAPPGAMEAMLNEVFGPETEE